MAENTDKNEVVTNTKHLWKTGESGNPKGRKKGVLFFSEVARNLLQAKKIDITYSFPKDGAMIRSHMHMESTHSIAHSLVAALIKEGMGGNVQAIRELIDRTQGKSVESIDMTTGGEKMNSIIYNIQSEDQKKQVEDLHKTVNEI